MQTAIHFCSVTFSNNLILTPINCWEEQEDKVMFIVRAEQQLDNAVIQLKADDTLVWESPLRVVPENAVEHPFTAEDDQSIIYASSHLVTKENLSIKTERYYTQVVNIKENVVISEVPFTIEFLRPEVQETSANIEAINSILAFNSAVSSAQNREAVLAEGDSAIVNSSQNEVPENGYQETNIATVISAEQPSDAVQDSTETAVEEELVKQVFSHELHYSPKIVGDILMAAADQTDYAIKHISSVNTETDHFQIVIEKVGNKYVSVINDPSARPMFFLENGQFIKEWNDDFNSYVDWLKDQLSLMFNISIEESSNWEILLIAEEEIAVDNTKVVVVSRAKVIVDLSKYAVILDVTGQGSLLTFSFNDGAKLIFAFANLTSIEQVQELLPKWQEVLPTTYILPTGLLANPDVLEDLTEQLKNASEYRRTSLAWEYVIQQSKK